VYTLPSKTTGEEIPTNRFQALARLGCVYLVDQVSRALDSALDWQKRIQETIYGGTRNVEKFLNQDDAHCDNNDSNNKTFLSSSVHGSRRHLRNLANNALEVVNELGPPTLFITLTCNPQWSEIQSQLFNGDSPFDRPSIVNRVFHAKLEAFFHNLRKGKYFGGLEIVYLFRVIEYQNRGMPHAHVVVKLKDAPTFDGCSSKLNSWVNSHISAEVPDSTTNSELCKLVKQHMTHDCKIGYCKESVTSKCSKHFDNKILSETSQLNDDGFFIYKRTRKDDLKVVSYNPDLLLDWQGHVNVECSVTSRSVLYLYRYLYKGKKQSKATVTVRDEDIKGDEIKLHIRGRYLCAMDAMWRVLGYETYPSCKPSVSTVKVMMPDAVDYHTNKDKFCDMSVYFSRPSILQELTMVQFFTSYTYYKQVPKNLSKLQNNVNGYFTIKHPKSRTRMYICRRQYSDCIIRLQNLYINSGDIWFLRLIMLSVPCSSFVEARTCGDIVFSCYQTAAVARRLVTDYDQAEKCYVQHMDQSFASEMRGLFACMTVNGYPTVCIYDKEELRYHMMKDHIEKNKMSLAAATNKLLMQLNALLNMENKQMSDFGLPMPKSCFTELEMAQMSYNKESQSELLRTLQANTPNNDEQQRIFDYVKAALDDTSRDGVRIIFNHGSAGTGKTELTKKLVAYARSQGGNTVTMAATTLACQNFDDGVTAHSFWKYPAIDEDDRDPENIPECKLHNTQRLELIRNTRFFVWDEMPSNHREVFEAAIKWVKSGVMFLIGDFRQILPIIERGDKHDIINACIVSSPHWHRFEVLHLTKNMRLLATGDESQLSHANAILALAEGKSSQDTFIVDETEDSQEIGFHKREYYLETQTEEALAWLFPSGFTNATIDELSNTAILCATNERVDFWNDLIQNMNVELPIKLISKDAFADVEDMKGHLSTMMTSAMLKTINAKGVPPHELTLKIGDICLVTRCLKCNGLATNSRVKILHITNYVIRVQTLQAKHNKTVSIPKIRFKFKAHRGDSFPIMRTQFPLRLAYGITYNKCQGMTLNKTLVDTIHPAFSHGHAFVATSRVRDKDGLKFFCSQSSVHPNGFQTGDMPLMKNVVYTDLLSHIGIGINNISSHTQHPNQQMTKEKNNQNSIPAADNNGPATLMTPQKNQHKEMNKDRLLDEDNESQTQSTKHYPLQHLQMNNVFIDLSQDESQTLSFPIGAEDTLHILDNNRPATSTKPTNSFPSPLQHLNTNHIFIDLSDDKGNEQSVEQLKNNSEETLRILNLANQAILNIDNFHAVLNHPHPELLLTTKFNIPITLEKLRCLAATGWLNDEVINFYMCMLQERDNYLCEQNSLRLKSHYFSTFFMGTLLGRSHDRYSTFIQNDLQIISTATTMITSLAGPGRYRYLTLKKYSSQSTSATTGLWQSFTSQHNKFNTTIPCPMMKVFHQSAISL